MTRALHYTALLVAAALSVVLSEVLMTGVWLPHAPFDVTGHYFLVGVNPILFVVTALASLILMPLWRRQLTIYYATYVVLFCLLHGLELYHLTASPFMDVVKTLAIICFWGLFWYLVLRRWLPAPAGPIPGDGR